MKKYIGGVHQLLRDSVDGLATSSMLIQDRINNIYISKLSHVKVEFERNDLENLLISLNEKNKNYSLYTLEEILSIIENSKLGRDLTIDEAEKVSRSIFEFYTSFISEVFGVKNYTM